MDITEKDLQAIHDSHDKIIRIDTILGNGDKGLCHDVRCHNQRLARIEIVIGILVGSGVLTGTGIGIAKLLGG